jgi:hypothetical protein
MSQRDAMRRSAARFLRPGETIQAVFAARTVLPMETGPALPGMLNSTVDRHRIIAVTDQRILLLRSGLLQRRAHSMQTGLSRSRRIGPPSGLRYVFNLGPEKLRVARRFFKDIEAADSYLLSS